LTPKWAKKLSFDNEMKVSLPADIWHLSLFDIAVLRFMQKTPQRSESQQFVCKVINLFLAK
jgi:hypothetical protein